MKGPIGRRSVWRFIRPMPCVWSRRAKAYYCYCSPQELQERREEALRRGESPRYDRRCRDFQHPPADRKPAIRLKAPLEGQTRSSTSFMAN